MFNFVIISMLDNSEISMINKENSNKVRILLVLEEIRFAGLANWSKKNNLFVVI